MLDLNAARFGLWTNIELTQDRLGNDLRLVTNQLEISCVETKHLSGPFGDGTLDQCQLARQRPMAYSPLARLFGGGDEQTTRVLEVLNKVAAELSLVGPVKTRRHWDDAAPTDDAAVTAVVRCTKRPLVIFTQMKKQRGLN